MSSRRRDEAGAVAVLVAFSAVVLFVIAALVVDLGFARDTRRNSQNAADASALAAANALYPTTCLNPVGSAPPCINDAVSAAKSYAVTNYNVTNSDWTSCAPAPAGYVVAPSSPTCISFDSLTNPTKVFVVMPIRNLKTGFGVAAGVQSVNVGARARAVIAPSVAAPCSICVIGSTNHDVKNLAIKAVHGDISINGSSTLANKGGYFAPSGSVSLEEGSIPSKGTVTTPNKTGQAAMPDPFANLAAPSFPQTMIPSTQTNVCNGPGVYVNPTMSGCTQIPSGLYVFLDGTFDPGGKTAAANTFYFTCSTSQKISKVTYYTPKPCGSGGEDGASLDLNGNSTTNLVAPTSTNVVGNAVPGMLFWYDQNNTTQVKLTGTIGMKLTGTIYMKSAQLYIGGTADATGIKSQVIVGDLAGNGDATFTVDPDSSYEYKVKAGDPSLDQ